jgi:hypothetical protein
MLSPAGFGEFAAAGLGSLSRALAAAKRLRVTSTRSTSTYATRYRPMHTSISAGSRRSSGSKRRAAPCLPRHSAAGTCELLRSGTEDAHGRSTPRDQPFSHGLDPKRSRGCLPEPQSQGLPRWVHQGNLPRPRSARFARGARIRAMRARQTLAIH